MPAGSDPMLAAGSEATLVGRQAIPLAQQAVVAAPLGDVTHPGGLGAPVPPTGGRNAPLVLIAGAIHGAHAVSHGLVAERHGEPDSERHSERAGRGRNPAGHRISLLLGTKIHKVGARRYPRSSPPLQTRWHNQSA